MFSQKMPIYISISNFILDTEAYKDILGDLPSINEENKKDSNKDNVFQDIILGIISDSSSAIVMNILFSLKSFLSNKFMPNNKMEEFKKYTEEKLKLEKTDQYYIHIGENAYIKII